MFLNKFSIYIYILPLLLASNLLLQFCMSKYIKKKLFIINYQCFIRSYIVKC